jgi:hypothetical protein
MTTLLERVKFLAPGGTGTAGIDEDITAELPELEPGFDRDPEPGPAVRKPAKETRSAASAKTAAKQPRTGGKFVSTSAQTKAAADEIEVMLKLLAFTWSLNDEGCAEVLNDTSAAIARDMAKLVSRSSWLMEHVAVGGLLGDILKACITLKPLASAVLAHHGPAARRARLAEGGEYDAVTTEPVVNLDRYGVYRPGATVA